MVRAIVASLDAMCSPQAVSGWSSLSERVGMGMINDGDDGSRNGLRNGFLIDSSCEDGGWGDRAAEEWLARPLIDPQERWPYCSQL